MLSAPINKCRGCFTLETCFLIAENYPFLLNFTYPTTGSYSRDIGTYCPLIKSFKRTMAISLETAYINLISMMFLVTFNSSKKIMNHLISERFIIHLRHSHLTNVGFLTACINESSYSQIFFFSAKEYHQSL